MQSTRTNNNWLYYHLTVPISKNVINTGDEGNSLWTQRIDLLLQSA